MASVRRRRNAAPQPAAGAGLMAGFRQMLHATFSLACFRRHESVTFSRISVQYAAFVRARELHHDRFGSRRDTLRHAGARPCGGAGRRQGLQARRSGRFRRSSWRPRSRARRARSPRPAPRLRTDADAAFKRNDFRTGLQILGQIAATAPEDSGNWLRLARTIFQITPANSSEQTFLLERASTAAYIAYQRAGNAGEEADALAVLGQSLSERKLWRPALDALAAVARPARGRRRARQLREDCATSTASGCSITPWIPIPPRRGPASSSPRTWPNAPTSRRSWRWPATTSRRCRSEGKQLCVDGLKHGERYNINLRAGLPSTVKESLPKSAEFNIYVRDRKPFVRFTGRAYVLPRTGQRGIPVVSVNTPAVTVDVFRIGDRNLINTVIGSDFQHALSRYELSEPRRRARRQGLVGRTCDRDHAQPGRHHGVSGRSGARRSAAGRLRHDGRRRRPPAATTTASWRRNGSSSPIWGVTAFSGNDGIHVFVNSLASTDAVAKAEVRLIARNNEILATRKTDDSGHVLFEAGLARGEGGLSPAMLTVTRREGRLRLPQPEDQRVRPLGPRRVGPGGAGSAPTPSSMPSAASIAPTRPSISPRCCATARAMP